MRSQRCRRGRLGGVGVVELARLGRRPARNVRRPVGDDDIVRRSVRISVVRRPGRSRDVGCVGGSGNSRRAQQQQDRIVVGAPVAGVGVGVVVSSDSS